MTPTPGGVYDPNFQTPQGLQDYEKWIVKSTRKQNYTVDGRNKWKPIVKKCQCGTITCPIIIE